MRPIEFESKLADGQAVYVVAQIDTHSVELESVTRIQDDEVIPLASLSKEDHDTFETEAVLEYRKQLYAGEDCMDAAKRERESA